VTLRHMTNPKSQSLPGLPRESGDPSVLGLRSSEQRVLISGWGLNGKKVRMEVSPGYPGAGIIFNNSIKANVDNAKISGNCTCLKLHKRRVMTNPKSKILNPKSQSLPGLRSSVLGLPSSEQGVMMVEHFLAACYGLGLWDLMVEIHNWSLGICQFSDSQYLPFGDGSALEFVRAFCRAGLSNTDVETQDFVSLRAPVKVRSGKRFIVAFPASRLRINCLIDYPFVGRQFFSAVMTRNLFVKELAPARTFGRYRRSTDGETQDLVSLLEKRLGYRLKREGAWVFPKRLRFKNEFCRHKTLDLLGDLALLGRPLMAEIFAFNPGHRLNLALVRKITELEA